MIARFGTKKIEFRIKNNTSLRKYCFYPLLLLLAISFVSCSSSNTYEASPASASLPESEEAPAVVAASVPIETQDHLLTAAPSPHPVPMSYKKHPMPEVKTSSEPSKKEVEYFSQTVSEPNKFDEYLVVLAADKQMTIPGFPGELRVWIGNPNYQPNIPDDMAEANTTLPALGGWAKIEPHASAFKLEPSISPCVKIDPSGSEVPFKLIPQRTGTFKVGATVYLFNASNCEESPVPKIATDLYVTVNVDRIEIVKEKGKVLWTIFWEQLLKFWEAFLILLFGLILFLIRGKLKRWFGYEKN